MRYGGDLHDAAQGLLLPMRARDPGRVNPRERIPSLADHSPGRRWHVPLVAAIRYESESRPSRAVAGEQPDADPDRPLVDVERALVQVARDRCRRGGARRAGPARPGPVARYQAKSSPPRLCSVSNDRLGPDARPCAAPASSRVRAGVVDHRRHPAGVRRPRRPTPYGATHAADRLLDHLRRPLPDARRRAPARCPSTHALARDRVGRRAGLRRAPRPRDSPARGSTRRDSTAGHVGDDLGPARRPGRRSGAAGRCGRRGRSAGPATWSADAGDRADPQPDRARRRAAGRSARRRSGRRRRGRRRRSTSSAPPGVSSSAGWKSSRTRPGSGPRPGQLGEHQPGAEHDGGVHVVAAGVRSTPATVERYGTSFSSGTGSASRSARSATTGAPRVAGRRRRSGRRRRAAAAGRSPAGASRAATTSVVRTSCAAELGVRVQVAAQRDQLVGAARAARVDDARRAASSGERPGHPWPVRSAATVTRGRLVRARAPAGRRRGPVSPAGPARPSGTVGRARARPTSEVISLARWKRSVSSARSCRQHAPARGPTSDDGGQQQQNGGETMRSTVTKCAEQVKSGHRPRRSDRGQARGSEGVDGDVGAPDLAQRVADLADRRPGRAARRFIG